MDLNRLKAAEACWNLSDQRKAQLVDQIYEGVTASRKFHFPNLKPLLSVAALAVFAFALLLAWPKKPPEETIVTLPGSSEAKPDVYVEKQEPQKEPAVQVTPSEKENPSTETQDPAPETQDPAKPNEPVEEPSAHIHRFWETEKEMPYEEAVAIVKEKVENRFYEPLTDKERMAYYQCILENGYINYSHARNLTSNENFIASEGLFVRIITTKEGIGSNFQKEFPLIFENGYEINDLSFTEIKEVNEQTYNASFYVGFPEKENSGYLEKDRFSISMKIPFGYGKGIRQFNFKNSDIFKEPLAKEEFGEIIRYYLSFEDVLWADCYRGQGVKVDDLM